MEKKKLYFAPLEGVAGYIFRNIYADFFDDVDKYFYPFVVTRPSGIMKHKELRDILKENNENIIDVLGTVVEYRNLESGEHIKRVKGFTRILAERAAQKYPEYSLTPEKIDIIVAASALHDIGKIGIPESILKKAGKLTNEEYEIMKSHVEKSIEMIHYLPNMNYVIPAVVSHHERYDGKGYPRGIKGEEIPFLR